MSYFERIRELTKEIPPSLIDFSKPRSPVRIPTQASSNFITNKEQGDWAEDLLARAINDKSKNFVAVKYGKSDDIIAGEEGFDDFFEEFQKELDTIGKRPDLLIFRKSDFNEELGNDISQLNHTQIEDYVKKAIAGIEVRSSAFLFDHYEAAMKIRTDQNIKIALETKDKILTNYSDLLEKNNRRKYLPILKNISSETISVADFRVPGWHASDRLSEVNDLFHKLKNSIKEVQKRNYLSITPKVEDIKVVYRWIENFNVSHYYFQVFFDKIYGISFETILEIISDPDNDGGVFSVERDTKNQNKTTIKINPKVGAPIATKVDEPNHQSIRKEMDRGRLLYYVTFNGGAAYLNAEKLQSVLNLNSLEF
jgi:type II restriction enzyme